MMRKAAFAALAALALAAQGFSQQLSTIAVVDVAKVYEKFFKDSPAVKALEDKRASLQAEIDKMGADIQALKLQKAEAEKAGDRTKALRLDDEIYRKTEFLKEYFKAKSAEIESEKRKLAESDSFIDAVYREIQSVAESEGYSMVLDAKKASELIWYSPRVDITDKVVASLMAKYPVKK